MACRSAVTASERSKKHTTYFHFPSRHALYITLFLLVLLRLPRPFIFNHMRHFVSDTHARTHAQTESTEIAFVIYQPAAFIIDPNLNYMNMLRVSAQSIPFAIHAPFLHCGSEPLSPCARNALVLFVCLFQFLLRLYGAYVLFHFVIFCFLLLLTFSPHVCWLFVCGDAAVAYHFVRM